MLAALAAVFAMTTPARADEGSCPPSVDAWVADAARAAGVPIHEVRCSSDHLQLRLEPPDAAPLDVDVARATAHAFRTAGTYGLSPMLEVDDFGSLPAARREPFERLVAWARAHPDRLSFVPTLPLLATPWFDPGAAWLLVAAALVAAGARRRSWSWSGRDASLAAAVTGLALALRLCLGAWGPLRVNGLGPLWIMAAAVDPVEAHRYGPGYAEIFGPLVRHLPFSPDVAVFAVNGVVSAILPCLVLALARVLGVDARRALVAGLALALDPASVRIATTESYVPVIAVLVTLASLAASAAAVHALRRDVRAAACLALSASLLCAQAARVHPAAWIPVALAPLAAAAVPKASAAGRAALGAAGVALCGAMVLATSAPQLLHVWQGVRAGELMRPSVRVPHAAWLLAPALLAAVAIARPRAPTVLGALAGVGLLLARDTYDQSPLWQASFDRLYAPLLLVGAAPLFPAAWTRARAFWPAAVGAIAGASLLAWPALSRRTTEHEEYFWARRWLASELPSGCRVTYVAFAGRRNLFLPTYASSSLSPREIARLDARDSVDVRAALGALACGYYVRTSLCSSAEGRPACDAVEHQLALTPVARASFTAVASNKWLPYDRDPVESVISRIDGYVARE